VTNLRSCFNGVYQGRRVLVTGHTGFKGSWLSLWLTELGAEVCGYALEPPSEPNHFTIAALESRLRHVHGDITSGDRLTRVCREFGPEIVIHMAAQSLVRRSYDQPALTFAANVMGTVNLLEAARQTPEVRAVLVVTSDKCYENTGTGRPFLESDPKGGRDPYSASKGCAEMVTAAYQQSFFQCAGHPVGLASVRAGNVIGGGDWAEDRLLPDCVRSAATGRPVRIRFPLSIRPWMHVFEVLAGYLWLGALLIENPERYAGAYNFGPPLETNEDRSVGAVVKAVRRLWPAVKAEYQSLPDDSPKPEAPLLALRPDRAWERLGWRTIWSLQHGLAETVAWYRALETAAAGPHMYEQGVAGVERYRAAAREAGLAWAEVGEGR